MENARFQKPRILIQIVRNSMKENVLSVHLDSSKIKMESVKVLILFARITMRLMVIV